MVDEGIRNSHQILGVDDNGNLKNLHMNNNGAVKVVVEGDSGGDTGDKETTLAAAVITAGTTAQSVTINKKVTQISVANYSETANVTVAIGNKNYVVGANIATDLPIGKDVTTMEISATEADTKVQYIVKGVE